MYCEPFQLACVPRKVLMSHSTSMPSAAKKPSCSATKSLRPMPLGATRTFLMTPPVDGYSEHYTEVSSENNHQCVARGGGSLLPPLDLQGGGHPAGGDAPVRREGLRGHPHRGHRRGRQGDRANPVPLFPEQGKVVPARDVPGAARCRRAAGAAR